ncbi:MAG: hypothetical protein GWN86_25985 [Desulfobacterales bacterium]|nr:hypothetical protein [Desulfobacterales bacterium]
MEGALEAFSAMRVALDHVAIPTHPKSLLGYFQESRALARQEDEGRPTLTSCPDFRGGRMGDELVHTSCTGNTHITVDDRGWVSVSARSLAGNGLALAGEALLMKVGGPRDRAALKVGGTSLNGDEAFNIIQEVRAARRAAREIGFSPSFDGEMNAAWLIVDEAKSLIDKGAIEDGRQWLRTLPAWAEDLEKGDDSVPAEITWVAGEIEAGRPLESISLREM